MAQYVYNKQNITRKVFCTVYTHEMLTYQKSHQFAALTRSISNTPVNNSYGNIRPHFHEVFYTNLMFTTNSIRHMLPPLTPKLVPKGRDPFDQNLRKYRSKTQSIGSVQPDKVRKNWSTYLGGILFPVGLVGIVVEWIAPKIFRPAKEIRQ